jgi:hypothetical protein
MIAKQVMMNYEKENEKTKCVLAQKGSIYFFDTGHIEFKGVMIPTCEVVFDKKERYKEKFAEEMTKLINSIRENLWEQKIFQDLMELLTKVALAMPKFSVTPAHPLHGMQVVVNESYVQLCRSAYKAYCVEEDYHTAVEFLRYLIDISEQIPSFDRLVLDYLKGVTDRYKFLLAAFEVQIDREVEDKANHIFQGNYYKAWQAAKNGAQVYDKLRAMGRKSKDLSKKKNIWLNMLTQNKSQMEFTLYSGKK